RRPNPGSTAISSFPASCCRSRSRTITARSTAPTGSGSCAGSSKRSRNRSCWRCRGDHRAGQAGRAGGEAGWFLSRPSRPITVHMISTQLVVVGGGPGGYAGAFLAADLGLHVVLVDTEPNPGGVCVYRGCIPSKALLHVAKVIDESRHA